MFEKYHADPAVSRIIGKYLVVVDVDIVKNANGEALYKKYGTPRGVPAWTVLDVHQKVLADSGDGRENVGFPYKANEIDHYVKALKQTCARISDAEIELLRTKLKEAVPARKSPEALPTKALPRSKP